MNTPTLSNKVVDTQEVVEALRDIQPRAYRYQFSDPISGKPVWRASSGPWNGQTPKAAEALYSVEQIAARTTHSPSDKTVELLREALDALVALHNSYVKAFPFANVVAQQARAAIAKLDSHLGEMK